MISFSLSGGDKLLAKLQEIANKQCTVEAGLFTSTQAEKGVKMEFGGLYETSELYRKRGKDKGIKVPKFIDIPPRPFMQDTFETYLFDLIDTAHVNILDKKLPDILGNMMVDGIHDSIDYNEYEPNHPRTIAIKESSHPLIDTGTMYHSIEYKVTK